MTEEQLFREALAHLPESVSLYGLDGTILFVNAATERSWGMTMAQLRGRSVFEVFPGTIIEEPFKRVAAGGPAEELEQYSPRMGRWYALRVLRAGEQIHIHAREITVDVRNRRRLETLARISQVVTTDDQDMTSAPRAVAQILTDVLDGECTLALLSNDGQWLEVIARASRDAATLAMTGAMKRWRADVGNPGEALRTRTSVLIETTPVWEQVEGDLRDVVDRYEPSSVLVVPLIVGDNPIGVLIVSRRRGRLPLTPDDRELSDAIAPSIALSIALARRHHETATAQQRLNLIADAIPVLVAFVDRHGRYQYANASYDQWLGKRPDEVLGKTPEELVGPDAYVHIRAEVEQALRGEAVRFRRRFPYPTGARTVDVQYVPVREPGGELAGFAALVQDISADVRLAELESERLDAERRLTARLQTLLAVTGKLAGMATTEDIARVLVDEGVRALGASIGALFLVTADGSELRLVRQVGFLPEHADAFQRIVISEGGPVSDCVRTGKPTIVATRTEYTALYPQFEPAHRPDPAPPIAFANLPLVIEGRVAGCLNISFHDERRLTPDERIYLELLASHGAEALRRAKIRTELIEVSETRAALIQASPAAIAVIDETGTVLIWNPAAEKMLGRTAADAIGRPHAFAADPQWRADLQSVFAGNVIHGHQVARTRDDGTRIDVELYVAPVQLSNGRTLCLSIAVDITERKRVERGRQLVASAIAIFSKSLDLQETMREILRVPLEGLADRCAVDIIIDPETIERLSLDGEQRAGDLVPKRLRNAVSHGGSSMAIATRQPQLMNDIDEEVLRRVARDDEHLDAIRAIGAKSALSVPLYVGDRVLGALTLVSRTRNFDELDVSIAAEIAGHAGTAIANAQLFDEARSARLDAENANRAKDEFMAMLGHELRNPLAPMVTALELMGMKGAHHLERERAVIDRQVHHLSRLVDDLLDVSRITRGKIELQRERVGLSVVVAKAIEQTSPLLEQRNHRLVVDVPADLAVIADPLRLGQIISNLVSNAAKYTPPAGLVEVRAHRDADTVVLTVRDNGIGIAPDLLPHVFDLFVQAPQSNARPAGGLGLGLTIVRSLVALHGGVVRVDSAGIGKGTELTVTLPSAGELPVAAVSPAPAQITRASIARRILVVDDNEDAAMLLAAVLEAHGHEMRTAFDGPSALRIADEFHPEIAVLDIGLPVMDGYELAQRLKMTPELADMRLIAVTGYGQESDRIRARAAGFQAHLAKPVPIEALVRLVDEKA